MGMGNSSTATRLDSSPTSKQQHKHQHFSICVPQLSFSAASASLHSSLRQVHKAAAASSRPSSRPSRARQPFCPAPSPLLRFRRSHPFIVAVHLLRPILVDLGVLIVIIVIILIIVIFSSVASSSTTVNVTTSSTSSSTSSSATPTGSQSAPFFLTIQTAASKRRQLASGSYLAVVNGQLIATDACNVIPPTAFTIDADRLRAGDSFATATAAEIAAPGYSAVEFAAAAAAGDVQTVFAVDAVAGLSWTNAVFLNGAADFCLLNNVVQAAYTVPIASIADCVPVNLVSSQEVCETPVTNIIVGVEISIDITIINVVNVINGATVTTTSTETKTVTRPMTRTSGPVVTSSVAATEPSTTPPPLLAYNASAQVTFRASSPLSQPRAFAQSASLPQLPQSLRPLFHVPPAQLLSLVLSPRLVEASHPHTLFLYQPPPPPVPQASRPQSSLQPLSPATQPPQLPTLVQLLPSAPRVPSSVSLSVSSFRSVSST